MMNTLHRSICFLIRSYLPNDLVRRAISTTGVRQRFGRFAIEIEAFSTATAGLAADLAVLLFFGCTAAVTSAGAFADATAPEAFALGAVAHDGIMQIRG
jgi:hypothetical protein